MSVLLMPGYVEVWPIPEAEIPPAFRVLEDHWEDDYRVRRIIRWEVQPVSEPIPFQIKGGISPLDGMPVPIGVEYAWTARCTECGKDYDFKVAIPNGSGVTQFEAKCMVCDRVIVDSRTLGIYARITPAQEPTDIPPQRS